MFLLTIVGSKVESSNAGKNVANTIIFKNCINRYKKPVCKYFQKALYSALKIDTNY